ncbi:hypothetical protein E3G68_005092 [Mycobacteroides abscessus]|uniref:hypothetical protein n=1 Tax=Mycobacteroides abscessus TaxID=36809 RepID=UPI001878BAD4|nr:hypothetical protein [Mycobacteroides abscessus]
MSVSVWTAAAANVESAQERAVRRVDELARAVSGVLEVLAAIYHDEDWRYLRDRCGEPYRDFAGFVRDKLGGSESNARRYRQGVETLVAPLLEITGGDVRIPVTPNDVAVLGVSGASRVVEAAPARLEGIGSAAERTAALRELIDTVIHERRRRDIAADVVDVLPSDSVAVALPAAAADAHAADDVAGLASVAGHGAWISPAGEAAGGVGGRGADEQTAERSGPSRPATIVDVEAAGLPTAAAGAPAAARDDVDALRAALEVVLRVDPALAADALGGSGDASSAARDCATAAQRLARLSNLLKVL